MITKSLNITREKIIEDLKQVAKDIFPDALNGEFELSFVETFFNLDQKTLDEITTMWCEMCEAECEKLFKDNPTVEDILAFDSNQPEFKYWLANRLDVNNIYVAKEECVDNIRVVNFS